MDSTPSDIVRDVRPVQYLNAELPMDVTLYVTDSCVTEDGITRTAMVGPSKPATSAVVAVMTSYSRSPSEKKVPGSAPSAVSISETAKRDENAATRAIANREALRTEDMDITLTTSPIITVRTRFRHFVQNVNLYEVDIDINIGLSKL